MEAYLLVIPQAIQGYDENIENIRNVHIFDVKYLSNIKRWFLVENHAHCNEEIKISSQFLTVDKFIKPEYINGSLFIINSISELRTYLADCQNKGIEVCGQCVATLYADNE